MKIIYLILAHNSPETFLRQLNRLCDEQTHFYVHIDKKVDNSPFLKSAQGVNNIKFVDDDHRVCGEWGTFSLVQAVLECMEMVSRDHKDGYVVLLSGADYPIKSRSHIREFLTSHSDSVFIRAGKLPRKDWFEGGLPRLTDCVFHLGGRRMALIKPYAFSLQNLKSYIKIAIYKPSSLPGAISVWFKRRELGIPGFEHYGGEFWFGAPMFSILNCQEFLRDNPQCVPFYKEGCHPDELFFNSLLVQDVRANINLDSCLRYIHWDYTRAEQPTTFTMSDKELLVPMLEKEDMLFARKFSVERDAEILDFVDNYINK